MIRPKTENRIEKETIHSFTINMELQSLTEADSSAYPGCCVSEYFETIVSFSKDFYLNCHGLLFYEVFE
jgi:hypothetical protein